VFNPKEYAGYLIQSEGREYSRSMSTLPTPPLTAEQYLEIERKAEFKSEFFNGEMFAMSGGTPDHSRLAARWISLIDRHLLDKECSVYTSDLRLLVEEARLYTYPDASVVCGALQLAPHQSDVFVNPVLLVEVLSPSTEQYDRGPKVKLYRTIRSLRECLLISQTSPEIELYRRENDENWSILTAKGLDSVLELTSIGYRLALRDLYRGILPDA
jgi:Uma2 family endonuclease